MKFRHFLSHNTCQYIYAGLHASMSAGQTAAWRRCTRVPSQLYYFIWSVAEHVVIISSSASRQLRCMQVTTVCFTRTLHWDFPGLLGLKSKTLVGEKQERVFNRTIIFVITEGDSNTGVHFCI